MSLVDEPEQPDTIIQDAEESEPLMSVSEVAFPDLQLPEDVDITPEEIEVNTPKSTPYSTWQADPTTDNLAAVLDSLRPTIAAAVASYGGAGNPQIMSKARVVAAKAIKNYNPAAGASLPTWVSNQLRQLTRDIRKSSNDLSVAEGIQLDGYRLFQAENEFQDENGREPTLTELADITHLSPRRIKNIRKKLKAVVMDAAATSEAGDALAATIETDYTKDALDYVYHEADTTDKKLIEYMTGYGGEDVLDNKAIMAKLKLTPVQLSRRKARLSIRINNIVNDLEQVSGGK